MMDLNKYFPLVFVVFLAMFVLVNFSDQASGFDCYQFDGNETGCTSGNASTVCEWFPNDGQNGLCDPIGCWNFPNATSCGNASEAGFPCTWNGGGSFCEQIDCWSFDGTNESTCVNNTVGIDDCSWDNSTGQEWCYIDHDASCDQFTGEGECFDSNWCVWNGTGCSEPIGGGSFGGGDAGCWQFSEVSLCGNVTGCSWDGTTCTGPGSGITCGSINESTFCGEIPFLDTCCAWNAGSCNATFSTSCRDNMQAPPVGANFCEDYNAITNQTVCDQIAGSPWYMPCKWHNQSTTTTDDDRCGFNGDNFFTGPGGGGFEDIESSSTCEAAGGLWRTEFFVDPQGNQLQDSWCEMAFGASYESCDSACWACEYQPDGTDWADSGAAQSACEASTLGYCSWRNATAFENAPNGFGFCEKPQELLRAGCGVQTGCEDYAFYTNPQTACSNDEDCSWFVDPEDPQSGWCGSVNAETCQESCSACLSQNSCENNGTNCQWDTNQFYCKPQSNGDSAEICFNGVDDDNDNMIDCADSNCLTDTFCGGGFDNNNCGQWASNDTCIVNGTDCVWVNDTFTGFAWCDAIGANCWQFDADEASCGTNETEGALGCVWVTNLFGDTEGDGFCDINETAPDFNNCFGYSNRTTCNIDGNCTWQGLTENDGFCDPKPFSCFNYFGNQTGCETDAFCNWTSDPQAPGGGFCDPFCFSKNSSQCDTDPLCETRAGFCEPANFVGGGCWQFDGNQTGCNEKDKCTYSPDPFAGNNVSDGEPSGWCDESFLLLQFQGMEEGEPELIAVDSSGCGMGSDDENLIPERDVCGIGIKDMENSYGFGMKMASLDDTALCNGRPLVAGGQGSGTNETNVMLFLDTDGNSSNGCNSTDNNQTGFDFRFMYDADWEDGAFDETKLSYRCVNEEWSLSPIPINSWPEKSCGELDALIIALDKEVIHSFSEFDKAEKIRAYASTSNNGEGHGSPDDTAGPGYYSHGSVDFIAEDCSGLVDLDGDGCLPAEDPDCELFNQYGFIPFEDCRNNIDDNFDGNVDCDDPMCKYDILSCPSGGGLVVDPNDVDPPALAHFDVITLPDSAIFFIDTFEPSNASLLFYGNTSSCTTVNKTVVDSKFKPWHDLPLNNAPFNTQALGYSLTANTTYQYKYRLCDISGNCLVSACANFTTAVSYDDCGRNCKTFLDPLSFEPPSGAATTDPLGHLQVSYDLGSDGSFDYVKDYGDSSSQETLNNTGQSNIKINNPNSTLNWSIICVNGTIPSTIDFNASALDINNSEGNGLVGMPTSDFKNKFQSDFGCEKVRITLPFNGDELQNCVNETSDSCTDVTGNATKLAGSGTGSSGWSEWEFDTELLGFSFYTSESSDSGDSGDSGSSGSSGGGSSSGGGGGSLPLTEDDDEENGESGGEEGSGDEEEEVQLAPGDEQENQDSGIETRDGTDSGMAIFLALGGVVLLAGLVVGSFLLFKHLKK